MTLLGIVKVVSSIQRNKARGFKGDSDILGAHL